MIIPGPRRQKASLDGELGGLSLLASSAMVASGGPSWGVWDDPRGERGWVRGGGSQAGRQREGGEGY